MIRVPMRIKINRGRKQVLLPEGLDGSIPNAQTPAQSALVQAIGRSTAWLKSLENGEIKSITELGQRVNLDSSYIRRILKLNLLSPEITESILNGTEIQGLSLNILTEPFPEIWDAQQDFFRQKIKNQQ